MNPPPGGRPVEVVVVAFHSAGLLERCLQALDGAFGVHVVDNSSDPQVRDVAARHGARYTDPGRNGGFGAGVNVALREILDGPPCEVLLLNPDARVDPPSVRTLAERLAMGPWGAVSPRLLGTGSQEQRVLWPFPTPGRIWREALSPRGYRGPGEFAVGAVLMLRWEALRAVGLFDERFFLYAEETDWQRRATDLGWSSTLAADVVADHVGAGTGGDPSRREALFHAGTETYVRKWHGTSGWHLYRCGALAGALLRGLLPPRDRAAAAWRRVFLYGRGPRRAARLERF